MLTVTVNDRPLDVAAIVERGRVLLPMRETFTALGATVSYDARRRVIIARSPAHDMRLAVGSTQAVVDGRRVALDVPPQSIAARTYVPLRFVAQSMGAVVAYDARANLVSVVADPNQAKAGSLIPAPQSNIGTAYPTISASLGAAAAQRSDVTLTVDGQDVTSLASFDGTTITYMPRIGLSRGTHAVVFSGRTIAQTPFSTSWSFATTLQAPPDAPALNTYDYRFYASGPSFYHAGDWMHFVLIAPPGGSAQLQLCGMGYQYPLWNTGYGTVYEANFPAPRGYWMPSCAVTATYTSWNGQQYFVPIPVMIGMYTGAQAGLSTPRPKASFTPRPIPAGPRQPEPTPAPRASPTPRPLPPHATPAPVHTPVAITPRPVIPRRLPLPHPHPKGTP